MKNRSMTLILGSAFFGMIVLVGGQMIVEHVFSYTVPVSVFIIVGGRDLFPLSPFDKQEGIVCVSEN